jgi:hypothetical protein
MFHASRVGDYAGAELKTWFGAKGTVFSLYIIKASSRWGFSPQVRLSAAICISSAVKADNLAVALNGQTKGDGLKPVPFKTHSF